MRPSRSLGAVLAAALLAAGPGCSPAGEAGAVVEVWAHAGQPSERATLEAQVARFNARPDPLRVRVTFLPEGSYTAQVQASAAAGRLPDLLDLDGPYVPLFAWQGHLRPLGDVLPDAVLSDVLPSILEQGRWRGELYAVGSFDSGLGLYARRGALRDLGVRIPAGPAEAWTAAELTEVLERLAEADRDGAVLDLKLNYAGEWFPYAFQPALRSGAGGLLARRAARPVAGGTLDGPASQAVLGILQGWIRSGRVDPNLDDAAFVSGRVALSWSGHWDFPSYDRALGDDLVVLPLPDFGQGTRTGQGSWMWAVPRGAREPRGAAAFLSFLLRPEEVLAVAEANGAVPGTRAAAARSGRYGVGGPLRLFLRQLDEGWAVPRPRTPAYPFVSSVFQDVFAALRNGEDLPPVLDRAARSIDREIEDNRGYPST